jgi:hypothetical protein
MAKTTDSKAFNKRKRSLGAKIQHSEKRTEILKKIKEQERLINLMQSSDAPDKELVIASCNEKLVELKSNLHSFNAKKIVYEGITFDSNLEKNFYVMLKKENINFVHQLSIPLVPGFELYGEKIKPVTIIIDFLVDNKIIDTKGNFTEKSKIKWKMLKYKFKEQYEYHLPSNLKQCEEIIQWIKAERD